MKLDEIDDKIVEELVEVKEIIKKKWYQKKPVIISFLGVITSTLVESKDVIIEYLKGLNFKYYILALVLFSLVTYYGIFKKPKPLEEENKNV